MTTLALDYRANIELIDQAKTAGVQHFIFTSVLGADRGYEDAPVFKAKWAVERYLPSQWLKLHILRPWISLESHCLAVYLLIGDPKNRTSIEYR